MNSCSRRDVEHRILGKEKNHIWLLGIRKDFMKGCPEFREVAGDTDGRGRDWRPILLKQRSRELQEKSVCSRFPTTCQKHILYDNERKVCFTDSSGAYFPSQFCLTLQAMLFSKSNWITHFDQHQNRKLTSEVVFWKFQTLSKHRNCTAVLHIWNFQKRFYYYLCVCEHTCAHTPVEARKGCVIPQRWSYRWLWAVQHGCWDVNSGPLREQRLLTATFLSRPQPLTF